MEETNREEMTVFREFFDNRYPMIVAMRGRKHGNPKKHWSYFSW